MENILFIKMGLIALQWIAIGLQIGFNKAKDNYKYLLDLTDDSKVKPFLNEKIEKAKNAHSICFYVIVVACIIYFCL